MTKAYSRRITVIKKRQIKKLFNIPHRTKINDIGWRERSDYIKGVMNLSGFHLTNEEQANSFNEIFKPDWIKLFKDFKENQKFWARYNKDGTLEFIDFEKPPFSMFVKDRFTVRFQ